MSNYTGTKSVNFSVARQANAHKVGYYDAFDLLVTVLEEQGSFDAIIDAIEDNASKETRQRIEAYYGARASRRS